MNQSSKETIYQSFFFSERKCTAVTPSKMNVPGKRSHICAAAPASAVSVLPLGVQNAMHRPERTVSLPWNAWSMLGLGPIIPAPSLSQKYISCFTWSASFAPFKYRTSGHDYHCSSRQPGPVGHRWCAKRWRWEELCSVTETGEVSPSHVATQPGLHPPPYLASPHCFPQEGALWSLRACWTETQ